VTIHSAAALAASAILISGAAQAANVTVFGSVAAKSALEQLAPAYERATQNKVTLHIATVAELKGEIDQGAAFNVAILTDAALSDLAKSGRVIADSKVAIAKSGVGVAVAPGLPLPAIATPDQLKAALLAAKSITYTTQGSTGPTIKKVFERLGISDAMNAKTVAISGMTAPQALVAGKAEMGFTQVSEILDTPAAQLAGPLPTELQASTQFSAAVSANAADRAAAQNFVTMLTSPAAKSTLKSRGLDPN
jgi:molybdate transport system substrate-binding protein